MHHKGQKRNWRDGYAILKIQPPLGHTFFRDGYSNGGVYTEQAIPASAITLVGILDAEVMLVKNWSKFWDWYGYKKGSRPTFAPRRPEDHQWR